MANTQIVAFSSSAALARAAAIGWLDLLTLRGDSEAPFLVALSGGGISKPLFSATAGLVRAFPERARAFAPVHFFWADERCVPPDDAESNFRAARENLFSPLEIPESRIHRIQGEASPETAAANAGAELGRLARTNSAGQPELDLVFLGMGPDGHTASLFPGEPEGTVANPAVYRPVVRDAKPPPRRITLGYPTIGAAREVWVLIDGFRKETALREALSPSGHTPLARVLQMRSHTTILTDIVL